MMTTKLSQKMRNLVGQKFGVKADLKPKLTFHADYLDQSVAALGDMVTKDSAAYRDARRIYMAATGRAWDWGAAQDLELMEREDA